MSRQNALNPLTREDGDGVMEGCSDFGAEVAALNSAANDLVRSPRSPGGFRSGIKGRERAAFHNSR